MHNVVWYTGAMSEQPRVEIVPIESLQPDPNNANRGTERGSYMLNDSLTERGAGRSALATSDGILLAGNKTHEQAINAGITEAIKVHTTGDRLVVVVRDDLKHGDQDATKLAFEDNRIGQASLNFDPAVLLAQAKEDETLTEGLWRADELEKLLAKAIEENDGQEATEALKQADVPDCIWPSDNDMQIPVLDLSLQADALDLPVTTWGAHHSRKKKMPGTYHFYTEDYRFNALWTEPQQILNSRCVTVVEPNYSVFEQTPVAVAIYKTYQKRWLARYWQSRGVRVFVDLNVNRVHREINLLGVPEGWKSFATRGYTDRMDDTIAEYEIACEICGGKPLFFVYGGGKAVIELCQDRGWLHIQEQRDVVKARGLLDG